MQEIKSIVKIKGSAKDGFVLSVSDSIGFKFDACFTFDELLQINYFVNQYVKKQKAR